jgi:acetylornithine deacetylase/succinyl-diaminopimelate desuccinylase-like protein
MSLPRDDLLGPAIIVSTDVISDPYPSISLIPSSVTVRFDRRTLLDEGPDEVVAGLLEAASGGESELFFVRITTDAVETYTGERVEARRFLPAWRLDDSHPLVAALIAAVTSAGMPVEIGVWGFCTNGSESMGVRGIPTIGFGPGWPEDAHVIDESVSVEEVLRATEVYRRLAAAHAGEVSA